MTEQQDEPTRREALKQIGSSGAVFFGAGLLAGGAGAKLTQGNRAQAGAGDPEGPYENGPADNISSQLVTPDEMNIYGGVFEPPRHLDASSLDSLTYPPPPDLSGPTQRDITMTVTEQLAELGQGVFYETWTYNGTAPGPVIRANEGDQLRVTFQNATERLHNLHFHGRHNVNKWHMGNDALV